MASSIFLMQGLDIARVGRRPGDRSGFWARHWTMYRSRTLGALVFPREKGGGGRGCVVSKCVPLPR